MPDEVLPVEPMFEIEPFDPDNPEHLALVAEGVSEHHGE